MSKDPKPGALYRLRYETHLYSKPSIYSQLLTTSGVLPSGAVVMFVSIPKATQKVSHSTNRVIDVHYHFIQVACQDMVGYIPCGTEEQSPFYPKAWLMLLDEQS
jgi:hypothetical protein